MRPIRRHVGPLRRQLARQRRPEAFKETYVNEALRAFDAPLYVEIGVRDGDSFRAARAARRWGIDPLRTPRLRRLRPGESFFEMTSDDFFRDVAPHRLDDFPIAVALVDGLHEFSQALRDLTNLERYMDPMGMIVLDDVNPLSREAAGDVQCPGNWNGDVWKVVAYLRQERPDLKVRTINADQGIGLVTGFGIGGQRPSASQVSLFKALEYADLESNRHELLGLEEPTKA